jgi:hypothetical protein
MADVYGLLAEFKTPDALKEAVVQTRAAGYRRVEAFTPFPVEGLAENMGFHDRRVPLACLLGGIGGALTGFLMQVYISLDYPLNVGGRALVPIPAFMVVTFELTILFAVTTTIITMLWINRLPRLSHPLFNVERFHLASRDRFFLCIEQHDERFDLSDTRAFLETLHPASVAEVPL